MAYEQCLVSFIDVMGFRNIIIEREPQDIENVLKTLRKATESDTPIQPIRRMKDARLSSEVVVEIISDAVARIRTTETQYQDGAFYWEIMDLALAQITCVDSGVLLRGGVSIGSMNVGLEGEGPIFGPALVRAVDIESNEAIYPRIVIDDEVLDKLREGEDLIREGHSLDQEWQYLRGFIKEDDADVSFIDYLRAARSLADGKREYFSFLENHKTIIDRELARNPSPRIKSKYKWLRRYHNSVVVESLSTAIGKEFDEEEFESIYGDEPVKFFHSLMVNEEQMVER